MPAGREIGGMDMAGGAGDVRDGMEKEEMKLEVAELDGERRKRERDV